MSKEGIKGIKLPKHEDKRPDVLKIEHIDPWRFSVGRSIVAAYIDFCEHVLERFPVLPYVFLARDATPIHIVMSVLKEARGIPDTDREVTVTRDLLGESFSREYGRRETYPERKKFIQEYVSSRRNAHSPLHRYIDQEIGDLEEFLMVDTGFWGTCPSYIQSYLQRGDYRLMFGIDPEQSWKQDVSEENLAWHIEYNIKHGHEVMDYDEEEGRIIVVNYYPRHELRAHATDYLKVRLGALEEVHETLTDEQYLAAWHKTLERIPEKIRNDVFGEQ